MSVAYEYSLLQQNDHQTPYKRVKGVLSIEGEELLFEFKVYDPAGNMLSTLNKFSINVEYLKNIDFKKGLFSGRLSIETTKMVFLDPLPGSSQGRITLKISRSDRNYAHDFAQKLRIALSERKLKEL
ncbi:MAG: hypothetical protein ED557_06735 [Balneola sp.]|nr:MAG: hypothetical protein ED557_06735 [Balneola sp.]